MVRKLMVWTQDFSEVNFFKCGWLKEGTRTACSLKTITAYSEYSSGSDSERIKQSLSALPFTTPRPNNLVNPTLNRPIYNAQQMLNLHWLRQVCI